MSAFDTITERSESDAVTTYRVSQRIWSGQTAYQEVEFVDSPEYGRMLFLDGELQSATADEAIYHETLVHSAIAGVVAGGHQPASGLRVLVVGGGEGATVREVLRWNPAQVVWVDIDMELVTLCQEHLGWDGINVLGDARVRFHADDIAAVLPVLETFDVIVLDLPDPDGETGWLYSADFFTTLRSHLAPRGAIVTHCGPVRPVTGAVGAGFQRIWEDSGLELRPEGFYRVGIPSFQGDWGFWIWRADGSAPFDFAYQTNTILPPGLRVLDDIQIRQWASPSRLWSEPVRAIVSAATATVTVQSGV